MCLGAQGGWARFFCGYIMTTRRKGGGDFFMAIKQGWSGGARLFIDLCARIET